MAVSDVPPAVVAESEVNFMKACRVEVDHKLCDWLFSLVQLLTISVLALALLSGKQE